MFTENTVKNDICFYNNTLYQRLISIKKEKKLTYKDISDRSGAILSQSNVSDALSNLKNGKSITTKTLYLLKMGLGIDDFLF